MATEKLSVLLDALSGKTPVDADKIPVLDSANAFAFETITLGDVKDYIETGLESALIESASPVLTFKDSSCTDADANFDITVAATDTGTGAEDIDVTFAAQVAGNKVGFINFDADGVLALGYGGQPVWIAKLNAAWTVTPNTGTATPASTNSGTIYTNEGDSDGSTITLPTAVAGLEFCVAVQAAQTLTITAAAGDTIQVSGLKTAAAGSISSATIGSTITLRAINATEWMTVTATGTWTL